MFEVAEVVSASPRRGGPTRNHQLPDSIDALDSGGTRSLQASNDVHCGSVAIVNTGLVTSVGLSSPAACAAIRAGLTNPTQTRFKDSEGEWMMGHAVPLDTPWQGRRSW